MLEISNPTTLAASSNASIAISAAPLTKTGVMIRRIGGVAWRQRPINRPSTASRITTPTALSRSSDVVANPWWVSIRKRFSGQSVQCPDASGSTVKTKGKKPIVTVA